MMCKWLRQQQGFSLVEMLVAVAVFGVIMTVAMSAYISQLESNSREYNLAEAEIEYNIALNNIIKTDVTLAGYGLANDYGVAGGLEPDAVRAVDNSAGDELFLTGTALGINSRATKGWSYYIETAAEFAEWTDPRENMQTHTSTPERDVMILMESNSKELLDDGAGNWLYRFNGSSAAPSDLFNSANLFTPIPGGTLAYGLQVADIKNDTGISTINDLLPYYVVRYYLGGTSPAVCASGTQSLLRAESMKVAQTDDADEPNGGDPLFSCVRNFQVAFGLDANDDGDLDTWDDGGTTLAGYSFEDQRKRVKQVRVYLLVQQGRRDSDYQYPNATVRVGDASLGAGVGEDVTLTSEQRKYRWRLLTLSVVPKNIHW